MSSFNLPQLLKFFGLGFPESKPSESVEPPEGDRVYEVTNVSTDGTETPPHASMGGYNAGILPPKGIKVTARVYDRQGNDLLASHVSKTTSIFVELTRSALESESFANVKELFDGDAPALRESDVLEHLAPLAFPQLVEWHTSFSESGTRKPLSVAFVGRPDRKDLNPEVFTVCINPNEVSRILFSAEFTY